MTTIDYFLLLPIGFGLIYGFFRGFFKELAGVICVLIAIFVARYFGEFVAILLSNLLGINSQITKPIAMIILFVATIFAIKLLATALTKLSEILWVGWLNKILGMLFGGLKWLLIVSVVVNFLSFFYTKTHMEERNKLAQSRFYKPIEGALNNIVPLLRFAEFKQPENQETLESENDE